MVTHPIIYQANYCFLTSVIWPFTLTSLTFGSCLYCANVSHYKDGQAVNFNFFYCANVSHYKDGQAVNFNFFSQRDNKSPNLNASEHSTNMSQQ